MGSKSGYIIRSIAAPKTVRQSSKLDHPTYNIRKKDIQMKIGCVHTGAGHAIFGIIEDEIRSRLQEPCVITHVTDPDLISRISQNQKIGPCEKSGRAHV